jgi:glutamate 5-kinase
MGVIPIVNENDTLSVTEIKFGDNDTLSAIAAGMVHADYLFLMTDVDCLYDSNPRTNPDAKPIEVVEDIEDLQVDVSSAGSSLGTGGMSTKIVAARLATSVGVTTVITRSSNPGNITEILAYVQAQKGNTSTSSSVTALEGVPISPPNGIDPLESSVSSLRDLGLHAPLIAPPLHTRFMPDPLPIRDRYFWLLHGLAPHGTLFIDSGAYKALANKAGLLPVGVVDVLGDFAQQEAVRLVVVEKKTSSDSDGNVATYHPVKDAKAAEVGRALVNYSANEIRRIKGLRSMDIKGVLGYADSEYVALRENISFFKRDRVSRPVTPSLDKVV